MAVRRVGLSIKPRFWLIVLTAMCMCATVALVRDGGELALQQAEIEQLEQQRLELRAQNAELKRAAEFAGTDEFIERQARALGMLGPDDVRYVFGSEEADYAQGGN